MPFTLLKARPIYLMINGNICQCCKIPIKAEINVIGIKTLIKKIGSSGLANLPKTKFIPSLAQFKSAVNPLAIVLIKTLPADVFKSKNPRTNWRISMVRIGLYFIFLRSLLTINAIPKTKASPATPIIYCMMISSVFLF